MATATSVSVKDITPGQCRAARALLDWTLERLAEACGLPKQTLVRFERRQTSPRVTTHEAIRAALEAAGVDFIPENGGGPGVRLRRDGDRKARNER